MQPLPPQVYQQHPMNMQQPGAMVPTAGAAPYRKRSSEADTLTKHIKKKRPTDKNMPAKVLEIESFVPEAKLYAELFDFEKKLDATIMRKRLDIQEALGKPTKVQKTLRLFISNTATDQQTNAESENNFDLNSGAVPSWTLRIDGHILEPENDSAQSQQSSAKLTTFFRAITVELDRDINLYPEGNHIEWQKQPNSPDFDTIEINRKGDINTRAKITLHLDSNPQKFKLSPALAELLDIKIGTKPEIVMGIWNYCKSHKLQDNEDKRLIRCDSRLAQLFGFPQLHFGQLPELITQHLSRPDPIVIDYVIRVDKPFHLSSKAYDVDVELDSNIRQRMINVISASQIQKDITSLDDKIVQCVQSVNNSKIKRDFLLQFSKSPVDFINKWIASQARDLEVILGENKVNLEEMRNTDFYKQPWMKEAVFHYLTTKASTQQRMQELLGFQPQ